MPGADVTGPQPEPVPLSVDFGDPAKFVEDFDNDAHRSVQADAGGVWHVGASSGPTSYNVKLLVRSGTKNVEDIWILESSAGSEEFTDVLHLHGAAAARLVGLMRNNAFDPADGSALVTSDPTVIPDANSLAAAYQDDPGALRALIESDTKAADVVALAHRKRVVAEFRKLIDDDDYFDAQVTEQARKSEEGVWQDFFEENPWLLGLGLSAHLFVGWDPDRLERVVAGADVGGPGKRVDALLRTAGVVRLLVFAEIKHHRTSLLGTKEYRSGCFGPHHEVSGAVAQSQGTVQLAQEALSTVLKAKDDKGFEIPGADAYLYRPRSFVVVGQLSEFVSDQGGHSSERIRSFELYRRNLQAADVITFDELLARAEALVGYLDS